MDKRFDRIDKNIEDLAISVARGFEQVDQRFKQVDERFKQVDERFEKIEYRLDNIGIEIGNIKNEIWHVKKRLDEVVEKRNRVDKRSLGDDQAIIDIVLDQQKKIKVLEKRVVRLESKAPI